MKEPKGAWAIVEAIPVHYDEPQLFLHLFPNDRNPVHGTWIPLNPTSKFSDEAGEKPVHGPHYYYKWEHFTNPRLVRKGITK